ncbi:MAG: hypothetical protein AB8B87_09050 [Granulosicoccus sp.]
MLVPVNNNLPSPLEPIQEPSRGHHRSQTANAGNEPAWFLTEGSMSLHTITATEDPTLQGASTESVASRILSHIGG